MDLRHDVWELTRFLTELSVIDYYFVIHKPSSVAIAALMFAMDEVPSVSDSAKEEFLKEMSKITKLDHTTQEVVDCRNRLRLLYEQGGYSRPASEPETRTDTTSPVCVSYGCEPHPQQTYASTVSNASEPLNKISRSSNSVDVRSLRNEATAASTAILGQ